MGKREETRQRIEAQIVELGRRQLATVGAAGLSVRAIARDLGMVSSAVYRYVASRDALLTLLLVDAYSDLADTVGRARAGTDGGWRADVATIAHALRQWATGPAGRLGAAVRQPGARLSRPGRTDHRAGHPGDRDAVRRGGHRGRHRRHRTHRTPCRTTDVGLIWTGFATSSAFPATTRW